MLQDYGPNHSSLLQRQTPELSEGTLGKTAGRAKKVESLIPRDQEGPAKLLHV